MKVSFTCHFDKMFFDLTDGKALQKLADLWNVSTEKAGGFATVTLSLPSKPGTDEQNRTFHSLIGEYWRSGCGSYLSYEHMRDSIKLKVAGAKEYIYFSKFGQITVKSLDCIPKESLYVQIPKSWVDFGKKQRITAIDDTIKEMIEAGVNSKKFDEIIGGMYESDITPKMSTGVPKIKAVAGS